ncbi:CPBP family intramembrane glutamic endopeptidase [Microterricola viridarii]|uniref:CAAX prenyl protease 2/Lysostaphin resistance protein A-like domain-containing protein n=1 Tax=Microterricola viridarii TaxID=412690 RepID=A0A0Y0PFK5_9MICO|nr:CPBP family intramembrane glutamic endopeptidase [Microterricola viridarii]AMB59948.1 hypothetical protein AWU67_15005 [Microterricola viridarii]
MSAPARAAAPAAARAQPRIPQRFWIGLVAVIVYVALAAGVSSLLVDWLAPEGELAEFALSHIPVLLPLIIAGLVFARRSGWAEIWRTPAAFETRPRRWWMLVIPLLMLTQSIIVLTLTPWGNWDILGIALVALITAMVGLGEELYFRGILRSSLRANHGETLTLLVTSLLFGAAHSFGSAIHGEPVGTIAFQVGVTMLDGVLFYAAFRATGRLWVAIALHALSDFTLYLSSTNLADQNAIDVSTVPANIAIQGTLWALVVVVFISAMRQDLAARRSRRVVEQTA